MAYLSQDALERLGFLSLGRNVRISDRAALYDTGRMRIGDNSRIDDFCVISGKVDIGRNVHVAPFCLVAGGRPGVTLSDFAGLAYRVTLFTQSDDYSGATMTNPTVPAAYKRETEGPVCVGRHVIVGAGAIIFPGVTLGDGSAVGAGTVVRRSIAPWTIVAGSPARTVRNRSDDLLALERQYLGTAEDMT